MLRSATVLMKFSAGERRFAPLAPLSCAIFAGAPHTSLFIPWMGSSDARS